MSDSNPTNYKAIACPDTHFCDVAFASPSFGRCIEKTGILSPHGKKLAGEFCATEKECERGPCTDGVCQGQSLGQLCGGTEDCGIGLYCTHYGKCAQLLTPLQECSSRDVCANGYTCDLGRCVQIFS